MTLKELELLNFRSYEKETFLFHPKMTTVTGPNGSGKTNLLEAIYMLSMTKSFRDIPGVVARDEADWFKIRASFSPEPTVELRWKDKEKTILLNDKKVVPHKYLGVVPVVLFEPGSMDMVRGAPVLRRQWMDRILCFSDKKYLQSLLLYRKVLRNRNNLLRQKIANDEQIFAWDMIMSEHAEYIVKKRLSLIRSINTGLQQNYRSISHTKDDIKIKHLSSVETKRYRENLMAELEKRLPRDQRLGSTSVGPHRDDIEMIYNNQPFSQHGSRGENRTLVLSLVLCELTYLKKHTSTTPVLLLDDVLSELDENRQQKLLSGISDVQTIVTSTTTPKDIGEHARIQL